MFDSEQVAGEPRGNGAGRDPAVAGQGPADPESGDPHWFDLASPATPTTRTYASWLASSERAECARDFGLRSARFVVLKGPGGS